MAIKDLVSQVKQTKLGKAISGVVSNLDRDKQQAGFQFTAPNSFARQGVQRVQRSIVQDPGQYGLGRLFANQVSNTRSLFQPVIGEKRAEQLAYGIRGASQFTPFNLSLSQKTRDIYKSTEPTTETQRTAQQVGRTLYGTALSAPIGGASKAVNVARNLITPTVAGAVLSPAIMTAGKFLTKRETPTGQELLQSAKQGAFQGFKSAPILAFTNPITSKVVNAYVSTMGGGGLANQTLQRSIGALANLFEDEVIAKTDGITPTSHERLLSLAMGALFTGNDFRQFEAEAKASGVPQSGIDAIKKQARSEVTGRYIQKGTQEQLAPRVYASGNIEDPNLTLQPRQGARGFELQEKPKSRLDKMRETQGGFVDFSAKIGGDVDPLIQEARKYKSAEEFVDSMLFRGEPGKFRDIKIDKRTGIPKTMAGYYGYPTTSDFDYATNRFAKNWGDNPSNEVRAFIPKTNAKILTDKKTILDFMDSGKEVTMYKNPNTGALNKTKTNYYTEPYTSIQKPNADYEKLYLRAKKAGYDAVDLRDIEGMLQEKEVRILNPNAFIDAGQNLYGKTKSQLTDIYNQATKGETVKNIFGQEVPITKESGFIDFGAEVGTKGTSQPKTQVDTEISKIKPEKIQSSRQKIATKQIQQQKGQLFREAKPVSGGSKIRAIKGEMVKASPSKVSSPVIITRDKKYAFNINKKKLGLNAEQSKQLDNVTEAMRPVLEANKGKTLTKQEIIEGGRKAKVLEDVVGRDEARQFADSLQASRNFLRSEQTQVGITPKFLEQLEIVSSVAADTGRRLQAFNIGAEDITIKEKVLRDILKVGADANEVLEAGRKVDWNDAKQITDFYRKFKPATLADKLDEYRYTNMLSSPNTHINNTFSNFMQTAVLAPIEKSIRGAVSFAEAKLTGKEQEYFARQGVDYARGYWKALPEAWENVKKEMSGISTLTKPDVDLIPTSTSKFRELYTTPLRMLQASDQFFRTLVKGGEIESLKTQGITGAKAGKLAEQEADYRTFRQAFDPDGKLGQNKVLQVWDKWNSVVSNLRNAPGGKYLVPFLQTPTNILKQGVEYSPLGVLTVPGSREPLTQLSKAIVGSTVFTGAYALANSGLTTWDTPTNANERAEFYAAGLQPYSIKIGDKWVSYSKLGPLSYPIAMASALKWAKDNGASEDVLATIGKTMGGTLGFFADQSYVRGIGDIIDAFRGDEYKQARGLSNIPAQMVPYRSFMGWVARLVDPVYRKTSGGTIPEQIGKSLVSQVPFASKSLEAYQTPFGTDSQRQFPGLNAFSPLSISQEKPEELKYYKNRSELRKQEREANKIIKQIEETGKVSEKDTNKLLTKQQIDVTKKKIEAGMEVSQQELETAYLDKVISMPKSNRYEKGMRDSELWSKTGTILDDENLSDAQKQALTDKIATELGVTKEDIQLYQVAKQDNAPKTLYVLDQVETMQSPDEILQFLVKGRKPVNGKLIVSDGVIDNLVDDGIIPYQLGKDLKKLDYGIDGKVKTKKTSGGGGTSKKSARDKALAKYLENLSKITLPSGKIRTQAPISANVKGLTFES